MKEFILYKKSANKWIGFIICLLLTSVLPSSAQAQYFGQNKVRYKNLKFKVHQTPHFELYYYLKNEDFIKRFLKESEVWYDLHQQVFRDTFSKKNPIILYANHPEFQQTTALQGDISVGTGGVTEGMKNRVIMPVMEIAQQTRHVLGHELVHAFQYHSLIEGDSTNLENIGNLPLWMVEGMAEYLSIGKVDAFTAMWMRDAYLNKDIPSLKDLTTSNKYFPYRYGEAFWSYIGSTYGDTIIVPFFKATAKYGYEMAIRRTFGYDERTLSNLWKTSIENAYRPYLKDTAQVPIGTKIIDNKNGGDMNVAPAISPDGKYIAFLSEKELFSIDLFLADAQTGKVLKNLGSKATNTHIEEFSFIESAGAWSPDSKKFAFSIFSKGRNKLLIVDVTNGRTVTTEAVKDIGEFSNLSWSPNGEDIAFTGLKEGQSDLYLYNLRTKNLTRLTNDKYSDYQPYFSSDGKQLVFSSDRTTFDNAIKSVNIPFNLATMDLSTKAITDIKVFNGANNLNPQFSPDNSQIYFLSNRDGFRNLYRYTINGGKVEQLTDYFTGISGITEYSPALSVSRTGDILYSYYRSQRYTIYKAKADQFIPKEVDPEAVNFDAATLPPPVSVGVDIINANLTNFERFETIPTDSIKTVAYKPQFKLDYLSGNGVGASVGRFGAGLQSGIQGIFSDILGRNQIYAAAAINGEIYDFGGQVAYINQQSRINWGIGVSHIPYIQAFLSSEKETIPTDENGNTRSRYRDSYDIIRNFEERVQLFAAYPFSRIHRFEVGTSAAMYSYRIDRFSQYYALDEANNIIGYEGADRNKVSLKEANQYYNRIGYNFEKFKIVGLDAAFVGDNSFFGVTSPLNGFRYRVGVNNILGDFHIGNFLVDLRKYQRIKPITLAGRVYSNTSFGRDQDAYFAQQFVGYPTLIRGYEYNSFYKTGGLYQPGFNINQLVGSNVAVANFEIRLPFTGPEKLASIKSKFLFSDLNAFFDIGLAYNSSDKVVFRSEPRLLVPGTDPTQENPFGTQPVYERVPAMSAGISLRVNVFGYFVLEPYYAIPFQRKDVSLGVFGLTFAPGW
ncbi:tolB protein precursor [Rubrolithibacter danxiaensis]|uniref:tolB protein precursor n=1 Tax=Rubrolithibacter danxiaensis TaxID=3390805 RepID=UPI003BF8CC2B